MPLGERHPSHHTPKVQFSLTQQIHQHSTHVAGGWAGGLERMFRLHGPSPLTLSVSFFLGLHLLSEESRYFPRHPISFSAPTPLLHFLLQKPPLQIFRPTLKQASLPFRTPPESLPKVSKKPQKAKIALFRPF